MFGKVCGRIACAQTALVGPASCIGEAALENPHSSAACRDRADIGEVARPEQRLGMVEHLDRAVQVATGQQQSCVRGEPAEAVLHQRCAFAELGSNGEVRRCGGEIAVLPVDVGEADVEITRDREDGVGSTLGPFEGLVEQSLRGLWLAASQPHVGQHDRRSKLVGRHAGGVEAGNSITEGVDGGDEVTGRPGGEPEEPESCTSGEMVVLGREIERSPCVLDCCVDVAATLSNRGPVHLDHRRERVKLAVPSSYRLGEFARRLDAEFRSTAEAGLGSRQPGLDTAEVAHGEPAPRHDGGQQGTAPDDVVGESRQPFPDRVVSSMPA